MTETSRWSRVRAFLTPVLVSRLLGSIVGLALIAYVVSLITGRIPPAQRLTLADLGVIVVGAVAISLLVWPPLLDRLQQIELGSLKLQLQRLQVDQQLQRQELEDIRTAVLMVVTDAERNHLENLSTGATANYWRADSLLDELRRLRALKLIRTKQGVSQTPHGVSFNLADYAELTDAGKAYLARVNELLRAAI